MSDTCFIVLYVLLQLIKLKHDEYKKKTMKQIREFELVQEKLMKGFNLSEIDDYKMK